MRSQVTVSWSDTATYRFDLEEVQPMPHEQARAWLDEQFTAMECEPIRLTARWKGTVRSAKALTCISLSMPNVWRTDREMSGASSGKADGVSEVTCVAVMP